jgi:glycosyltransferase involved in cell wall biosynthesis
MRLMFVHYLFEDRGSAQDVHHFAQAARELGHEVALYGPPNPTSAFNYSLDLASADAVIFIFEWTTDLQFGDRLDLLRLVSRVPRRRRVVIDCDGKYNDAIDVVGDYNHADAATARQWVEVCDSLTDKICQPTLHPLRPDVQTYFFHAYHPGWEAPVDFHAKEYGLYYVGNNWFRWRSVRKMLEAIEPVRDRVGRIGMVGHGWDRPPPWANPSISADAYASEPEYLRQLDIEVNGPVHFKQVIDHMSKGVIHPVVYRPLFNHLQLVTCRTFETFAANTIPLFGADEAYVTEFYGDRAHELILPAERPQDKVMNMLERPDHYAEIVRGIRQRLREKHSYAARLRELIEIVER